MGPCTRPYLNALIVAFPSRLEIPGIPGTGILTNSRDFRAGNPGTEVMGVKGEQWALHRALWGIALHDSHYYKTHTTICILQVPLLTSYKHNTKMLKGKMGIALHDSHYYKTHTI